MIVLRLSIKELRVSGIGVVTKTNPPLFNSLKYLNAAISLIRVLPIPVCPANKHLLYFSKFCVMFAIASSCPNLGLKSFNVSR